MSKYFAHQYEEFPFSLFSISHSVMIAMFLIGIYLIYRYQSILHSFHLVMRKTMLILLFLFEFFYHVWLWTGDQWNLSFALPLHLCSISLILCLLLLITESRFLFQVVFYIGVAGATMAMITPELFLGFPHFRYFQFFFTHMLIIWICFYYVFVMKYRPTKKGLIVAILAINLFAVIAMIVNKWTGGNYMFLSYKPVNGSILDYFGPYPIYILILEGVALVLFWLILIPFSRKSEKEMDGYE
ncbi:YwaF family protein [Cytobacillus purgationiresistens]|uniref:Integral membrane protein (TIGR02206 family) n=1 Tax=Cytobacillus purgationiresistens TaxID=863449 RepID=A0ABU0AES3_9BACI|nr:TIGR02206 family membrane protein [Cytobacillus purgationiresistens]MDQ0269756.1 putative integral membrane protein (TIGR02206 family) [Cytobacillus purgationiresistens]